MESESRESGRNEESLTSVAALEGILRPAEAELRMTGWRITSINGRTPLPAQTVIPE